MKINQTEFFNPKTTFGSVYLVFVNKEVTNPKVLEGEDIIEDVTLTTYIVRYDLEIDFSEPRKAKRAPRKKIGDKS